MSATVISAEEQAESLGLNGEQDEDGNWVRLPVSWEVVTVPMTFPRENRPVRFVPVANMTRKTEEVERPKLVTAVDRLLGEHKGENVLIHTVSYALTRYLDEELRSRGHSPLTYGSGKDRDSTLKQFTHKGGIILAPSLDRGIDLPGELCRVQIIAKVPFPSLGDRQVSTRMYLPGGKTWYKVQTVRTLVQMTGRAVRSKNDWAVTYILDRQFGRFYKDAKHLFPEWWRESVEVVPSKGYVE